MSNNLDEDEEDDYEMISPTSLVQLISSPKPLLASAEEHFLREDAKPAGLKNVGNTCWFNSIIQVSQPKQLYFNLLILKINSIFFIKGAFSSSCISTTCARL